MWTLYFDIFDTRVDLVKSWNIWLQNIKKLNNIFDTRIKYMES